MRQLTFLKQVFLILVSLSSGAVVAAGLFTFIVTIGLISRLTEVTRSAKYIHYYETSTILGAIAGSIVSLGSLLLPIGTLGLGIIGLFCGIFVGCLIGSIAEILNAFPIFFRRLNLKKGLSLVILALALGKFVGVLIIYFL